MKLAVVLWTCTMSPLFRVNSKMLILNYSSIVQYLSVFGCCWSDIRKHISHVKVLVQQSWKVFLGRPLWRTQPCHCWLQKISQWYKIQGSQLATFPVNCGAVGCKMMHGFLIWVNFMCTNVFIISVCYYLIYGIAVNLVLVFYGSLMSLMICVLLHCIWAFMP